MEIAMEDAFGLLMPARAEKHIISLEQDLKKAVEPAPGREEVAEEVLVKETRAERMNAHAIKFKLEDAYPQTPDNPIYCAVSKESCDEQQTYLTHKQGIEQKNFACYLCREISTPYPTNTPNSAKARFLPNGAIIGGIGAILCSLIVFVTIYHRRNQQKAKPEEGIAVRQLPPSFHVDPEHAREITVSEIEDPSIYEEDLDRKQIDVFVDERFFVLERNENIKIRK